MDGETQMHFCAKCFGTRPVRASEDRRPERFEAFAAIIPITPEASCEESSIEGCICVPLATAVGAVNFAVGLPMTESGQSPYTRQRHQHEL